MTYQECKEKLFGVPAIIKTAIMRYVKVEGQFPSTVAFNVDAIPISELKILREQIRSLADKGFEVVLHTIASPSYKKADLCIAWRSLNFTTESKEFEWVFDEAKRVKKLYFGEKAGHVFVVLGKGNSVTEEGGRELSGQYLDTFLKSEYTELRNCRAEAELLLDAGSDELYLIHLEINHG